MEMICIGDMVVSQLISWATLSFHTRSICAGRLNLMADGYDTLRYDLMNPSDMFPLRSSHDWHDGDDGWALFKPSANVTQSDVILIGNSVPSYCILNPHWYVSRC
jgi:hypothetical protein